MQFSATVLSGGPSWEREISNESANAIIPALVARGVRVREIDIGPRGEWRLGTKIIPVASALAGVDAVFNALHGEWGESGQAQALLEHYGVPYTGSRPVSSALGMDKWASRKIFQQHGLLMPSAILIAQDESDLDILDRAYQELGPPPWVVKPRRRGSSVGVVMVDNEAFVSRALSFARSFDPWVILEKKLHGPEISCGVLEYPLGYAQALPPTLIVPPAENGFFDYDAKYTGITQEITPLPFSSHVIYTIQDMALAAYKALGCRHYGRVDMFLEGDISYLLEVNTLPGLTPESIIPKQARMVGFSFPSFIEHLFSLAKDTRVV